MKTNISYDSYENNKMSIKELTNLAKINEPKLHLGSSEYFCNFDNLSENNKISKIINDILFKNNNIYEIINNILSKNNKICEIIYDNLSKNNNMCKITNIVLFENDILSTNNNMDEIVNDILNENNNMCEIVNDILYENNNMCEIVNDILYENNNMCEIVNDILYENNNMCKIENDILYENNNMCEIENDILYENNNMCEIENDILYENNKPKLHLGSIILVSTKINSLDKIDKLYKQHFWEWTTEFMNIKSCNIKLCDKCDGKGYEIDTKISCEKCYSRGCICQCDICEGIGKIKDDYCYNCHSCHNMTQTQINKQLYDLFIQGLHITNYTSMIVHKQMKNSLIKIN